VAFAKDDAGADKASAKVQGRASVKVRSKAGATRKRDASPLEAVTTGLAPM
jgi:hypothetical protein